jgi:hypothetical protein
MAKGSAAAPRPERGEARFVTTYTILPGAPGYWITKIADNGLRKRIERLDTEDAAVRRLRALQQAAQARERRDATPPQPKGKR